MKEQRPDQIRRILKEEAERIFRLQEQSPEGNRRGDDVSFKHVLDFYKIVDDEIFLRLAYRAILKREPDPSGFDHYLSALRECRYTREDVLFALRYGKEGRKIGVKIKSLLFMLFLSRMGRVPIIGLPFRVIRNSLLTAPETMLQIFERESYRHRTEVGHNLSQIRESIKEILRESRESVGRVKDETGRRIDLLEEKIGKILKDYSEIAETGRRIDLLEEKIGKILKDYSEIAEGLKDRIENINALLDCIIRTIGPKSGEQIQEYAKGDENLEAFYQKFEDKFRGARDRIRKGFRLYVPYVREVAPSADRPVLDVGCGRGEWLSLLRNESIPALGVDINPIFVRFCKGMGLDAVECDIFVYLSGQREGAFSAITAYHFIEHISFDSLLIFLKEANRCLKPGGVLIIETPNPRNILVGSGDFYRDPTHLRPVFPDTLETLCEAMGFAMGRTYFFDNDKEKLIEARDFRFDSLDSYVSVSRDYAWIGYKLR